MTAGNIDWLLCAGTTKRAGFRERVEAAASAGFNGITLFPEHYLDARRQGFDVATLRSVLGDNGVRVHQIDPLLDWFGTGASRAEALMYEAAHAVEARSINVAPAFAPTDEVAFLVDRLGRLSGRAQVEGLSLDFEPLPWTTVPNLEAALGIIDACGVPNLGLMLDAWHFFRSGSSTSELTPEVVAKVTGAQLNDLPSSPERRSFRTGWDEARALAGSGRQAGRVIGFGRLLGLASRAAGPGDSAMAAEALTRRRLPGEGDAPVAELLSALLEGGYEGALGIEVFSTALHRIPPEEIARRAMRSARSLLPSARDA